MESPNTIHDNSIKILNFLCYDMRRINNESPPPFQVYLLIDILHSIGPKNLLEEINSCRVS